MKFPHLNLLFFMALLALTSCDKEKVALSNDILTEDSSVGMRCCDDATSQMLEDPRFQDFYDEFTNGVFDPVFAILDEFDSDELNNELIAFEECTESGSSYEDCLGQSPLLTRLIDVINGFDMDMLLTLQNAYDYLDKDELDSVILEAVDQTSQDSERNLQCYQRWRVDVVEAFLAGGLTAATGVGAPASIGVIAIGVIVARLKYCNCLYSNYGAQC